MTEFFRFPRTPHLAWLGAGEPRPDKLLTADEARDLLAGEVVVEEKIDGANIGISVGPEGALRVQSRGSFLDLTSLHPQARSLRHWLSVRQTTLADALGTAMLFGEWCYAKHSIHYTRLPDWFIAFDVYDLTAHRFWSVPRRDVFVGALDLAAVPRVAQGRFDLHNIRALLGPSRFADGPAEGLYVRSDRGDYLERRVKLVSAEFTQAIGAHWSRGPVQANRLASPDRTFGYPVAER